MPPQYTALSLHPSLACSPKLGRRVFPLHVCISSQQVLLAAQRPPATNFLSSPTHEVGALLALLEGEGGQEAPDVSVLQVSLHCHNHGIYAPRR